MISTVEWSLIDLCLEGFFFGTKTSVLCALTLTHAKKVQSFLALGIYSGIFALYLQCSMKKSRTANTLFYHLICLLYVLSMATVVIDLLTCILQVSDNSSICKIIIILMRINIGALSSQLQNDSQSMALHIEIFRTVVAGSCDLIYQCILVRMNRWAIVPIHFIHLNLQRSSVVGSCGVEIFVL
jgi:hypothetical protein